MSLVNKFGIGFLLAGLVVGSSLAENRNMASSSRESSVPSDPGAAYTVVPGDTISGLSLKLIGTSKRWKELYAANRERINDPNNLRAGTVIVYGHLVKGGEKVSPAGNISLAENNPVDSASKARSAASSVEVKDGKSALASPTPVSVLSSAKVEKPISPPASVVLPPVVDTRLSGVVPIEAAKLVDAAPTVVTGKMSVVQLEAIKVGSAEPEKAKPAEPGKKKTEKKPQIDLIMKGDAVCTTCHEESDDYPVLSISKTRHGVRADGRTPTCIGCHGESTAHLKVPKGSDGQRPLPDMPFGKTTLNNVTKHNQACQQCHQSDKLTLWSGSPHARREVACSQCHKLHSGSDKMLSRATVSEGCMNCHTEKKAMINRPSRHPVTEGKVVCTDCHAAHGSAGPKLMLKDSVVQTCYTCHMEKRGPFLWNHLPVTQDCSICHNPHGSVNPNLLKQRPPFLCQQCHEPTSHRGGIPVLVQPGTYGYGGAGNPFGFGYPNTGLGTPAPNTNPSNLAPAQARACLNCHSNIHGGNNPTNTSSSRSFRR